MFKHLAVLFSAHIFYSVGWGDRDFRHDLNAIPIPSDLAQTATKKIKKIEQHVCIKGEE